VVVLLRRRGAGVMERGVAAGTRTGRCSIRRNCGRLGFVRFKRALVGQRGRWSGATDAQLRRDAVHTILACKSGARAVQWVRWRWWSPGDALCVAKQERRALRFLKDSVTGPVGVLASGSLSSPTRAQHSLQLQPYACAQKSHRRTIRHAGVQGNLCPTPPAPAPPPPRADFAQRRRMFSLGGAAATSHQPSAAAYHPCSCMH
jgi:hypothetical protein